MANTTAGTDPPGIPGQRLAGAPRPAAAPRRQGPAVAVAVVAALFVAAGVLVWSPWSGPGPAPVGLATGELTSTTTALTWSGPSPDAKPERYTIRRNGIEVASVPGTSPSFEDSGLTALTTYRYSVLAVADGRPSLPTAELAVTTRPSSPGALTKAAVSSTGVTVAWTRPEGKTPDHYLVRRDDAEVATVPGSQSSYADSGLAPLTDVSYSVVAVTEGQESAPTADLKVTTSAPAVGEGRFQGVWSVSTRVTTAGGGSIGVGDTAEQGWTFTPRCAGGACPVTLAGNLGGHPFTATLNRSGAAYTGSVTAHISHCRTKDVRNTVSIALTVKGAAMEDGIWAATTAGGTLRLVSPRVSAGSWYCPAQTVTFAVSGKDLGRS